MANIFEPWHEISNNEVCATSKGSDQPSHTRSLIRAFAGRLNTESLHTLQIVPYNIMVMYMVKKIFMYKNLPPLVFWHLVLK